DTQLIGWGLSYVILGTCNLSVVPLTSTTSAPAGDMSVGDMAMSCPGGCGSGVCGGNCSFGTCDYPTSSCSTCSHGVAQSGTCAMGTCTPTAAPSQCLDGMCAETDCGSIYSLAGSIAAGKGFTCTIVYGARFDDPTSVLCWGANSKGVLGRPTNLAS